MSMTLSESNAKGQAPWSRVNTSEPEFGVEVQGPDSWVEVVEILGNP